ncbi:hypothetical protein GGF41_002456, partial [Coemansia sp. RSA 2531]
MTSDEAGKVTTEPETTVLVTVTTGSGITEDAASSVSSNPQLQIASHERAQQQAHIPHNALVKCRGVVLHSVPHFGERHRDKVEHGNIALHKRHMVVLHTTRTSRHPGIQIRARHMASLVQPILELAQLREQIASRQLQGDKRGI